MKKILTILLCAIIALQPVCIFAEEDAEATEVVVNSNDLQFAQTLGLLPEDLTDDVPITRLQLADMFSNILINHIKADFVKLVTPYTDIAEDNYSVKVVSDLGIMNGAGGTLFNPQGNLTYFQLLKTFVVFLGYGEVAEAKGGYPAGYYMTALDLDIVDKNAEGDEIVTAARVASTLKLSLNAGVRKKTAFENDSSTAQIGRDYLYEYLGIKRVRGILTAIHSTDMYSKGTTEFYTVKINDNAMRVDASFSEILNLLGYQLDVYIKTDGVDEPEILYFEKVGNNVVVIEDDQLESFKNDTITYYGNSTRAKKIKLSSAVTVIYNGTVCASYDESTIIPFKGTNLDGNVTAIDHNGDDVFEVIIVDAFDTLVVSKVYDGKIYNEYRPATIIDISQFEDKDVVFENILGDPISLDYFKKGDIISVSKNLNGDVKKIILTVDSYKAVIDKITYNSAGNIEAIYFGDSMYKCSNSLSLSPQISAVKPGRLVKAFFNKNGEISDIEYDEFNIYTNGFLIKYAKKDGLDADWQVGVFTTTNKYEPITLCENVLVNETSTVKASDLATVFGMEDATNIVRQPIMYQLNEDGKMFKLCVADTNAVNDLFFEFQQNFDDSDQLATDHRADYTYNETTGSFSGKLLINSGTNIFIIPTDRDNLDGYHCVTSKYFDRNDRTTLFRAYGTDSRTPMANILTIEGDISYAMRAASPFAVVDKVHKILDENGDSCIKLTGVIDGVAGEVLINEADYTVLLNRGDIIRYELDLSGRAKNITILYDGTFKLDSNPSAVFTASPRYSLGTVVYRDDALFTVEYTDALGNTETESFPLTAFKVVECNEVSAVRENKGAPRASDGRCILEGSQVFIYTYGGDGRYIVVYNR